MLFELWRRTVNIYERYYSHNTWRLVCQQPTHKTVKRASIRCAGFILIGQKTTFIKLSLTNFPNYVSMKPSVLYWGSQQVKNFYLELPFGDAYTTITTATSAFWRCRSLSIRKAVLPSNTCSNTERKWTDFPYVSRLDQRLNQHAGKKKKNSLQCSVSFSFPLSLPNIGKYQSFCIDNSITYKHQFRGTASKYLGSSCKIHEC